MWNIPYRSNGRRTTAEIPQASHGQGTHIQPTGKLSTRQAEHSEDDEGVSLHGAASIRDVGEKPRHSGLPVRLRCGLGHRRCGQDVQPDRVDE